MEAVWKDGTYQAAAVGYNGRLKVNVTIEDGHISEIKLKSHVEDAPYVTRAVNGVFPAIISANDTASVDTVSSATTTSEALIAAVRDALEEARP